jgi:zinc D-Ala-D-Ala carboxypeptidase
LNDQNKIMKISSELDDIPEALRDTPTEKNPQNIKLILLLGGMASIGAIALGVLLALILNPKTSGTPQVKSNIDPTSTVKTDPSNTTNIASKNSAENTLLGHFAYKEAPQADLVSITNNGIRLRKAAAKQFQNMISAARSQGVNIVVISGFRSISEQKHLFFDVKAQRGQVAAKRATVSAPPGYSEHHTGYAVDLGDSGVPATNLNQNFENTRAYKWLQANAARYSFEISFPRNNIQGVSYEPWHWRYVGDQQSLETFYKAKNIKPSS